jgi:hypothetical protein
MPHTSRQRLTFIVAIFTIAVGIVPATAQAAAPTVVSTSVSDATETSVTLNATVETGDKGSTYRFEYGPQECVTATCTKTPVPDAKLKASTEATALSVELSQLPPGTKFHFRVVVKNAEGETASPDATFSTYPPPPVFGPCPNDAFRTGLAARLPDCRAYEQVSPVDKNGSDLWSTPDFVAASSTGDAATFLSDDGIPGGVGAQQQPLYISTRGENGWTNSGILPPPAEGQVTHVLGWLPDLSQTFVQANTLEPGGFNGTLLSRDSSDGDLTTVVPHTGGNPVYGFAGASAGGARILFESTTALTPAAVEGKSNVYVYDTATAALQLASVLNDDAAPPDGAVAGPYDWFRGTNPNTLSAGGSASHYYTRDSNVISADGKSVFFTAGGTGQLYLRRNPTMPQSPVGSDGQCTDTSLACTIAVSATQRSTPDAAGTAPAAFQAASSDGRYAYFTSSEKLTNDANTGPEPEAAAVESADTEGNNRTPPLALTHGGALTSDSEHLYWVDLSTGTIARSNLDGTDVQPEFITATHDPRGLAVVGDEIYWTNEAVYQKGGCENGTCEFPVLEAEGTIGKATLNGDEPATDLEQAFIKNAGNPDAVAADGSEVFWTNDPLVDNHNGYIGRANAVDGSDANSRFLENATNVTDQPGIAIDSEFVYWMSRGNVNEGNTDSRISRVRRDGTEYEATLVFLPRSGTEAPQVGKAIAVAGDHLYWATQGSQLIGRAHLDGAEPASEVEPEFVKDAGHPIGITVTATDIYWTSNGEAATNPGDDLYRYDSATGELADLSVDGAASNGAEVRGMLGISEDGSDVYFAANGVLAPGAAPGTCRMDAGGDETGICNVYVYRDDQVEFVATVSAGDGDWRPESRNGVGAGAPREARVSRDGEILVFVVDGDIYRYAADTHTTICVSCDPSGESSLAGLNTSIKTTGFLSPLAPASVLSSVMSADGGRIFFETSDSLSPADTNGSDGCPSVLATSAFPVYLSCQDVYEWEANGVGTCQTPDGCIYLLTPGDVQDPSFLVGTSASGDDVFILTRARLVPQDTDHLRDLYDARVGGGLPSQYEVPAQPCSSREACGGAGGVQDQFEGPGTAQFEGPGTTGRRESPGSHPGGCKRHRRSRGPRCVCPRGTLKVHKKCVSKRSRHHYRRRHRGRHAATSNVTRDGEMSADVHREKRSVR